MRLRRLRERVQCYNGAVNLCSWCPIQAISQIRKPSLEVAPTTLTTFLADSGNGGRVLDLQKFPVSVTYLQFPIRVCFSALIGHPSTWPASLSSYFPPVTMTMNFDL